MVAMPFVAVRPSGQTPGRFATAHARRVALSGALAVLLMLAACSPVAPTINHPTTTVASALTLYTRGGAVRASDGAIRWTQALGSDPALLADGVLYAHISSAPPPISEVRAVRASDGATLWTARPQGCCGPLALTNTTVLAPVFQLDDFQPGLSHPGHLVLVALRRDDGRVAWRSAPIAAIVFQQVDTPAPFISPLVVSSGLVVAEIAVTPETSNVVAWHLDTGKLAWRTPLAGRSDYDAPSLSDTPAGVVVSVGYGPYSDVATFDLATGKPLWHRTSAGSSFLATDSVDVLSNSSTGVITGVRPSDGTVLWQANLGPSGQYCSCEIAADADTVYYRSLPSDCPVWGMQVTCVPRLSAIRLDSGALRWQRTLDAENPDNVTNVVTYDGMLLYQTFTASQSGGAQFFLLAFDARDGHLLWRHTANDRFARLVATKAALFAIAWDATGTCPAALESLSPRNGSRLWVRDSPPCTPLGLGASEWLMVS